MFTDLFGYSLNEATIQSANALYYEQLAEEESLIRNGLVQAELAHFDESGVRSEGKLHWLHVACSSVLTYFYGHQQRGKAALQDQASVWKSFTGRAVHDCWASYFTDQGTKHALCGAHLLGELTALVEQGSQWASKMHKLLLQTYQDTQKGKNCLPPEALQKVTSHYQDILQEADQEEPPSQAVARGRPRQSKGRNLMNRLGQHQEAVLAFAQYPEVPFTARRPLTT